VIAQTGRRAAPQNRRIRSCGGIRAIRGDTESGKLKMNQQLNIQKELNKLPAGFTT
jgi:hypothetical protein